MWHLVDPSVFVYSSGRAPLDVLSCCGTYIATGQKGGSTITITNLRSKTSPQPIHTDMEVQTLALVGNILLTGSDRKLVAWRLTERGRVDGDYNRAYLHNSIWTVLGSNWEFSVGGQTMFLRKKKWVAISHAYHTGTGEELQTTHTLCHHGHWYVPQDMLCGQHYLHHRGLEADSTYSQDGWPVSPTTLREGWIKDPKGKHRLWMPIKWRTDLSRGSGWLSDIMTLWLTHKAGVFIVML